ncbi:hypothetical protein [Pikeienuella sp. HZG-20]|uniref:hypothetical protein n=1 Tax=Paludibacillus litoralis TaxID=3133267 RepID=UPI0030EB4A56
MTRAEIAIAIAGALLAAFLVGWLAHSLWLRLISASSPRSDRADELAAELLTTEADRDRISAEARLAQEKAAAALREREAELQAAMEALGAARSEIEALRRGG